MKPTNFRHWFGWEKTPQHQPATACYLEPQKFCFANHLRLHCHKTNDILPGRLTNVPWKPLVGSDVFPIEIVPFEGTFVSFRGCNNTKIVSPKGVNACPITFCLGRGLIENSTEGSIYLLLDSRMLEKILSADAGGDSVYMKWSQVRWLFQIWLMFSSKSVGIFFSCKDFPHKKGETLILFDAYFWKNIGRRVLYLPPTQDSSGK